MALVCGACGYFRRGPGQTYCLGNCAAPGKPHEVRKPVWHDKHERWELHYEYKVPYPNTPACPKYRHKQ